GRLERGLDPGAAQVRDGRAVFEVVPRQVRRNERQLGAHGEVRTTSEAVAVHLDGVEPRAMEGEGDELAGARRVCRRGKHGTAHERGGGRGEGALDRAMVRHDHPYCRRKTIRWASMLRTDRRPRCASMVQTVFIMPGLGTPRSARMLSSMAAGAS